MEIVPLAYFRIQQKILVILTMYDHLKKSYNNLNIKNVKMTF